MSQTTSASSFHSRSRHRPNDVRDGGGSDGVMSYSSPSLSGGGASFLPTTTTATRAECEAEGEEVGAMGPYDDSSSVLSAPGRRSMRLDYQPISLALSTNVEEEEEPFSPLPRPFAERDPNESSSSKFPSQACLPASTATTNAAKSAAMAMMNGGAEGSPSWQRCYFPLSRSRTGISRSSPPPRAAMRFTSEDAPVFSPAPTYDEMIDEEEVAKQQQYQRRSSREGDAKRGSAVAGPAARRAQHTADDDAAEEEEFVVLDEATVLNMTSRSLHREDRGGVVSPAPHHYSRQHDNDNEEEEGGEIVVEEVNATTTTTTNNNSSSSIRHAAQRPPLFHFQAGNAYINVRTHSIVSPVPPAPLAFSATDARFMSECERREGAPEREEEEGEARSDSARNKSAASSFASLRTHLSLPLSKDDDDLVVATTPASFGFYGRGDVCSPSPLPSHLLPSSTGDEEVAKTTTSTEAFTSRSGSLPRQDGSTSTSTTSGAAAAARGVALSRSLSDLSGMTRLDDSFPSLVAYRGGGEEEEAAEEEEEEIRRHPVSGSALLANSFTAPSPSAVNPSCALGGGSGGSGHVNGIPGADDEEAKEHQHGGRDGRPPRAPSVERQSPSSINSSYSYTSSNHFHHSGPAAADQNHKNAMRQHTAPYEAPPSPSPGCIPPINTTVTKASAEEEEGRNLSRAMSRSPSQPHHRHGGNNDGQFPPPPRVEQSPVVVVGVVYGEQQQQQQLAPLRHQAAVSGAVCASSSSNNNNYNDMRSPPPADSNSLRAVISSSSSTSMSSTASSSPLREHNDLSKLQELANVVLERLAHHGEEAATAPVSLPPPPSSSSAFEAQAQELMGQLSHSSRLCSPPPPAASRTTLSVGALPYPSSSFVVEEEEERHASETRRSTSFGRISTEVHDLVHRTAEQVQRTRLSLLATLQDTRDGFYTGFDGEEEKEKDEKDTDNDREEGGVSLFPCEEEATTTSNNTTTFSSTATAGGGRQLACGDTASTPLRTAGHRGAGGEEVESSFVWTAATLKHALPPLGPVLRTRLAACDVHHVGYVPMETLLIVMEHLLERHHHDSNNSSHSATESSATTLWRRTSINAVEHTPQYKRLERMMDTTTTNNTWTPTPASSVLTRASDNTTIPSPAVHNHIYTPASAAAAVTRRAKRGRGGRDSPIPWHCCTPVGNIEVAVMKQEEEEEAKRPAAAAPPLFPLFLSPEELLTDRTGTTTTAGRAADVEGNATLQTTATDKYHYRHEEDDEDEVLPGVKRRRVQASATRPSPTRTLENIPQLQQARQVHQRLTTLLIAVMELFYDEFGRRYAWQHVGATDVSRHDPRMHEALEKYMASSTQDGTNEDVKNGSSGSGSHNNNVLSAHHSGVPASTPPPLSFFFPRLRQLYQCSALESTTPPPLDILVDYQCFLHSLDTLRESSPRMPL